MTFYMQSRSVFRVIFLSQPIVREPLQLSGHDTTMILFYEVIPIYCISFLFLVLYHVRKCEGVFFIVARLPLGNTRGKLVPQWHDKTTSRK